MRLKDIWRRGNSKKEADPSSNGHRPDLGVDESHAIYQGLVGEEDEQDNRPSDFYDRKIVEIEPSQVAISLKGVCVSYGNFEAVHDVSFDIPINQVTAIIGPSGTGKSTLLKSINRMLDIERGSKVEGLISYRGKDLYGKNVDGVEVRRRIGMVFQKPNPFPKSIFDNVAYGPRILGIKDKKVLHQIVERSLRQAALWDEVKDDLKKSGLALSGGQQQRLCIARAIAVEPEIILMDEPCSALDPIATHKIEELIRELSDDYTIVIVTHNMQQAWRVSDMTAFMMTNNRRGGELIEYDETQRFFSNPYHRESYRYKEGLFG